MPFNRMFIGDDPFYIYKIDNSCRFNDDDSAVLGRTHSSTGDLKKWSFAFGIKRANLGIESRVLEAGTSDTNRTLLTFTTDDTFRFYSYTGGTVRADIITNRVFRDTTSWYHILVTLDALNSQITFYVSGEEAGQTVATAVANVDHVICGNTHHTIARSAYVADRFGDYYLAYVHMVDGQELTPTDFGGFKYGVYTYTGYSGTYGTNGFYLDFADSADLGDDESGNTNDFTSSGLTADDQVTDTPTNNYCTLNPLYAENTKPTLSDGNLKAVQAAASDTMVFGTQEIPSGVPIYFEATCLETTASLKGLGIGVAQVGAAPYLGSDTYSWGIYSSNTSNAYFNSISAKVLDVLSVNDVVMIAISGTNMWIGRNGTWYDGTGDDIDGANTGAIWNDVGNNLFPAGSFYAESALFNFGQPGFTYTPPAGYKALCSDNITDPTVKDSSKGFYANTRTGTGAEATISDVNFPVDDGALIWIKNRGQTDEHMLVDTVRGATKEINSDSTNAESTEAQGVKSFSNTGYVLGTGAGGYNDNTETFVDWVFRKGSKYGLDIVSFSGTGAAHAENHSLGGAPELMLFNNLTDVSSWRVYHNLIAADPETDYLVLDTNAAFTDDNTVWNDTAPTSTQFTIGTANEVNGNTDNIIAYLFRSITGFSKCFSYTGNGNADGPYINCGFRPAFILIKEYAATSPFSLFDCKRDGYNVDNDILVADDVTVEATTDMIDILSNGFKIRNVSGDINTNTNLYVGYAVAEQTGKWSNAR